MVVGASVEGASVVDATVAVGTDVVAGGAGTVVGASMGSDSAGGSGWVAAAGCDTNVTTAVAPTTASNRILRWRAFAAVIVRRAGAIQDMRLSEPGGLGATLGQGRALGRRRPNEHALTGHSRCEPAHRMPAALGSTTDGLSSDTAGYRIAIPLRGVRRAPASSSNSGRGGRRPAAHRRGCGQSRHVDRATWRRCREVCCRPGSTTADGQRSSHPWTTPER